MNVTAKDTTSALRRHVYPALKLAGFDDWTSRKAWRHRAGRIDHIEFRSFNRYDADTFNCTPASVSVWVGISLPNFPYIDEAKTGPKGERPIECQMRLRGELGPSQYFPQVASRLGAKGMPSNAYRIWVIETIQDADDAAHDISKQFEDVGLPWLRKGWSTEELLQILTSAEGIPSIENYQSHARFWIEAGNPDSPMRNEYIAELAVALNRFELASKHYDRSRWAKNMETGEKYLFLPKSQDDERRKLAEYYRRPSNYP